VKQKPRSGPSQGIQLTRNGSPVEELSVDPGAVEFMIASSAPAKTRPGYGLEIKYDGWRVLASRNLGKVRLRSRGNSDATDWFPRVTRALEALPGAWIVDAELCVIDDAGIPDFEALRGRKKNANRAVLFAFDLLALGAADLRGQAYLERKRRLRELIPPKHPILGFVDYIEGNAPAFYQWALSQNLEGIVAKKLDAPYVGGRSQYWLKTKPAGHHVGWGRAPRSEPGPKKESPHEH